MNKPFQGTGHEALTYLFFKELTMAEPSQNTKNLISQAYDDLGAAQSADLDDAKAVQALQAAESAEAATKATSIQAHKTALASAGEAIKAMAQELGYTLPTI